MKKSWLAYLLSFFLPGAGLIYLGKWKWGVLNFIIVILIGFVLGFFLPESFLEKYMRLFSIGFAAASGGIAFAVAKQMNLNFKN